MTKEESRGRKKRKGGGREVDRNKEDGKEDWVGKEKGLKGRNRGLGKIEKTEINLRERGEGGGERKKREERAGWKYAHKS